MREVKASKAKGKPYTIVFVGVNGVGKSTNLSKVAYWLLQNNMKVSLWHQFQNVDYIVNPPLLWSTCNWVM